MKTFKYIAAISLTVGALNLYTPIAAQTTLETPQASQSVVSAAEVQKLPRAASWQGKSVAVRGRDVVSFFQEGKPQKGSKKYAAAWDDTTWRFASEENRKLFLQNPEKYVPQFGGFCPVALAENKAKIGHVNQYTVHNDRLYLNYNRKTRKQFSEDADNFLLRAQLNF